MMRRSGNQRGYTLLEIMIVVVIAGIAGTFAISLFSKNFTFFQRMQVRQRTMLESRSCMDTIQQRMRNGKANSLIISTPTGPPVVPNSRADFVLRSPTASGATVYAIYLATGAVYTQELINGTPVTRKLASNVTALMFTGNSTDPAIVNVTLRIDAPWDSSGDTTHVSTLILPNQVVHMADSP